MSAKEKRRVAMQPCRNVRRVYARSRLKPQMHDNGQKETQRRAAGSNSAVVRTSRSGPKIGVQCVTQPWWADPAGPSHFISEVSCLARDA